jgi:hypothetical protein
MVEAGARFLGAAPATGAAARDIRHHAEEEA